MADLKQFLDFPGLSEYDKLIKEYIKTGSSDKIEEILQQLVEIGEANEVRDGKISDIEDALEVLNGDAETPGSVDAKIKEAVNGLVDGAPEALDTLKEIADWIGEDETGTAALINRVSENEKAISELQASDEDLKAYIDAQDFAVYDSIQSIEKLKIASLFPVIQGEDESAASAIASVAEGSAVKLAPEQTIADSMTISKSCYIDANGSTFEGNVTITSGVDVIIENATFANPVVVM